MMIRAFKTFLFLVAAVAYSCASARAEPIMYTFSGIGTGTFTTNGGTVVPFTNAAFTITAMADTTGITNGRTPGNPLYQVLTNSDTITIGNQTASISTTLYAYDDPNLSDIALSIQPISTTMLFGEKASAFATYNLSTALPSVAGMALSADSTDSVQTSLGTLQFTNVQSAVTFVAVVPEPASLGMLGMGLLGVLMFARHRRAQA